MATQLKKVVAPSGGDYTSLEACMNANEQNLVTADKYFDVEISGDWTSAPDTTVVTLHNYTCDATRKITVYTTGDAKHDGTFYGNAKAYVLQAATILSNNTASEFSTFQDMLFDGNSSEGEAFLNLGGTDGGDDATIKRCIFIDFTANTLSSAATQNLLVENCMFIDCERSVYAESESTTIKVYNCTSLGGDYGFLRVLCQNCYSGEHSTEDFFTLAIGSDYCVSADTSANDECTNNTTGKTSYSDYFENVGAGAEDLHIKNTSNNLWGLSGTDLSGIFTDDIDGDTRSAWDIGADEYVSGKVVIKSPFPTFFNT